MSSPDHPSARDRAAEVIAAGLFGHLDRAARHAVAAEVVDALLAHSEVLSALAGVPHPGVEELAEVIDPAAFDPRGSVTSPVNAYARGKRQRAALDAAERVRALLGHTPGGET